MVICLLLLIWAISLLRALLPYYAGTRTGYKFYSSGLCNYGTQDVFGDKEMYYYMVTMVIPYITSAVVLIYCPIKILLVTRQKLFLSKWQDILDIAKRCQELDESSNSSNESTSHKKDESDQHHTDNDESLIKDNAPISSEGTMNSLMFETPDLMEDVLGCLDDKYRKFLMG
eukprot:sb/3472124/